jgi:hypothetical protein
MRFEWDPMDWRAETIPVDHQEELQELIEREVGDVAVAELEMWEEKDLLKITTELGGIVVDIRSWKIVSRTRPDQEELPLS